MAKRLRCSKILLFITLPPLSFFVHHKDNTRGLQKSYKNVSKNLNIEILFVSLHQLTNNLFITIWHLRIIYCKQANPQTTVKRIDKIRFILHIIICNNPAKYTSSIGFGNKRIFKSDKIENPIEAYRRDGLTRVFLHFRFSMISDT